MAKAVADPATRDKLLQSGMEPVGGSAEQFAQVFHADVDKYARLAKELKISQ